MIDTPNPACTCTMSDFPEHGVQNPRPDCPVHGREEPNPAQRACDRIDERALRNHHRLHTFGYMGERVENLEQLLRDARQALVGQLEAFSSAEWYIEDAAESMLAEFDEVMEKASHDTDH